MQDEKQSSNKQPMEDYGSSASDSDKTRAASQGKYSGGIEGTKQGSGEGEQFGEFGNTGTGTDLTIEMENSDPRTGMVKGGERNADDVGGPARYGGSTGSTGDDNESKK